MTPEKRMSLDIQSLQSARTQKPIDETIARNSKSVLTPKNNLSALHDFKNNPFYNPIVKDMKKITDDNERRRIMKIDMQDFIDTLSPEKLDKFDSMFMTYKLTN